MAVLSASSAADKAGRLCRKFRYRLAFKKRRSDADEYRRMAAAALEQTGEYLLELIADMKASDWADTRDNLHNVRNDLRGWKQAMEETLSGSERMTVEEAKAAWEYVEATLNRFGKAAFIASMRRLRNRGYFSNPNSEDTSSV